MTPARTGNTRAVASFLISVGADTEARTAYKMTPLHVAAFYGSADVTEMLLEDVKGIAINALDFGSCEPWRRDIIFTAVCKAECQVLFRFSCDALNILSSGCGSCCEEEYGLLTALPPVLSAMGVRSHRFTFVCVLQCVGILLANRKRSYYGVCAFLMDAMAKCCRQLVL